MPGAAQLIAYRFVNYLKMNSPPTPAVEHEHKKRITVR
jgi:hypothetical protein